MRSQAIVVEKLRVHRGQRDAAPTLPVARLPAGMRGAVPARLGPLRDSVRSAPVGHGAASKPPLDCA